MPHSSPGAPARGAGSVAIWTTIDQALSSASNSLMVVFGLNALLVGLQVAICVTAGLVFGSAIAIAISVALSSSVIAAAGVLWVHHSIRAVARLSSTCPGSAVNVSGGIGIQ